MEEKELNKPSSHEDKEILAEENKKSHIKSIIMYCLIAALVSALCFESWILLNHKTGFGGEEIEVPSDGTVSVNTVKHIIEPASELVTGKYYYTNAVSDEDVISIGGLNLPGTKNKYVFTYDGTLSAGYDLSEATVDVDNDSKTISISLPEIKILSSEVNEESFEIKYKSSSVFNDSDLERNSETRAACEDRMRKKAMNDEKFVKLTKDNAEMVLKAFLTSSGDTKKYKVEISFAEEK